MNTPLLNTTILAGIYLALFCFSEWLYHFKKVEGEVTRKITHAVSGILALSFPFFVNDLLLVGLLSASFLLLLFAGDRWGFLQSIHKVGRKTHGSKLFPVAVFLCYCLTDYYDDLTYYYAPLLILAISDPFAAMVGKNKPIRKYTTLGHQKSFGGSGAFLLLALLILTGVFYFTMESWSFGLVGLILLIAVSTTIVEAFGHSGWDNLTIPLTANVIIWLWIK